MQNQINKFHSFNFPKIKTDFILSIGSMCRPAHHLRKNHLRELTCPLDWMINDKLEVVYELFRSDFKDFFRSCFVVKQESEKLLRVKDNHNGMISLHHFFANEDFHIQAKRVNEQAIRRWGVMKEIILSSKNVVFVRSGNFDLKEASQFLQNIAKLFGKKQNVGGGGYYLINVSHNANLQKDEMIMQKFDLGENLTLIHYGIYEPEDDYRGNIPFWTRMLKQSIIMQRSKVLKNAWNEIKIRFIRSCRKRKAFFTKKIINNINETH